MDELISILLKVGTSELDEYTARFIASAGLIVANIDEGVNEDEINRVIESLSSMKMFPRQFLDEIAQGNVSQIFIESAENILRINPGMREGMLKYMISIVLSDKLIDKEEVDLLYHFGDQIGLSDMEVASAIGEAIQMNYVPSLESIC